MEQPCSNGQMYKYKNACASIVLHNFAGFLRLPCLSLLALVVGVQLKSSFKIDN